MNQKMKNKLGSVAGVLVLAALVNAAWAAEPAASAPAADESLDVLRQRLAERLSNKKVEPTLKVVAKGKDKEKDKDKDEAAKSGKKGAEAKAARAGAAAATTTPPLWAYTGDGAPERWADLSPGNKLCAAGTRQSPIDLRDSIKVELEKVQIDYPPMGFSVIDTGHTIQVNLAPGGSLTVMGRRFELMQFHFHRPSEERINGRSFDMVVHLVHKDAGGRLAVLAVLLDRGTDNKAQALVQTIWNNLPLEKGEALTAPGLLDVNRLLPEDRGYFTYMGSLTEPPCTEGVLWLVMRQPVALSSNQIGIFSRLYPMNARPIQASSGRLIKESQ